MKQLSYFALGLMVALLSGCASNGSGPQQHQATVDVAQTYGLTSNQAPAKLAAPAVSYFHSSTPQKVVNPMTAPANQIYYFPQDGVQLNPADLPAIKVQANYLITHPDVKVRLEGYTYTRGSREYNIVLGWKRIKAVVDQLLQDGVAPSQLEMVSYGKEKPPVDGYGEPVWALDRQVQLVYKDQ